MVVWQAKSRAVSIIDESVAKGAKVVLDGRKVSVKGFEKGNFLGPTILDNVNPGNPGYDEEIFGPVRVVRMPGWAVPPSRAHGTHTRMFYGRAVVVPLCLPPLPAGAVVHVRRDFGRRHRADQQEPVRQRHGDLHLLRRRRPQVPARG